MPVGHKKIAVKGILHAHIISHGPKIITQVQKPSWPDATKNNLFFHDGEDKGWLVIGLMVYWFIGGFVYWFVGLVV
jgi:hypothetical protein